MKPQFLLKHFVSLALCVTALRVHGSPSPTAPALTSIGIYDSRAVAYAHFWQPAECARRDALIATARAAKVAGDRARFAALAQTLQESQDRVHLQVFSTAPATEAMATLAPQLPALLAELGITRLVSRWDEAALRECGPGPRLDVTDRLVRAFLSATDKQRKVLASLKSTEPLSLAQAQALLKAGRL